MEEPNVISFEERQGIFLRREAQEGLRDCFDRWMDQIVESMKDRPTLEDLSRTMFLSRKELLGKVAGDLLQQKYRDAINQETMSCPGCGQTLNSRGLHERTVETMIGEVKLKRPYFYCVRCHEGYHPLDEMLELSSHRKQWDMQKSETKLVTDVPYERASEHFEDLTGLSFSDHAAYEIAAEIGKGLSVLSVSPTQEEMEGKIAEIAGGKRRRPVLVLSIDGAHAPIRPERARGSRPGRKKKRKKRAHWKGEWHEAKGFRLYLIENDRIEHILSWHQVQDKDGLRESLRAVKEAGLIPEDKVRLCVIADGAIWIWNMASELFPNAEQVLDYYHCSEYLHKMASVQFSNDEEKKVEWVEAAITRLCCGEIEGVLQDLEDLDPKDSEVEKQKKKTLGYLIKNKDRIDYPHERKAGYPTGSGGIESSNKYISNIRLKRSGAWWYVAKANEMLALRCAVYNGTYDRVFQEYKEKKLVQQRKLRS